jgi:adenylate kinase family enzyme
MSILQKKISRIRSGGQSGVDRAAMDFAREQGIPLCGWCPKNGWAEDYPDPPGLLLDYPELTETTDKGTEQRTKWNMRDCDAILTIIPEGSASSPGTMVGLEEGKHLSKPMFTAAGPEDVPQIIKWISSLPDETELCIGGPRASECPEAYDAAKAVLNDILEYYSRICEEAEKPGEDTDSKSQPRRILVIGSPGAGKSTFSRKLRDRTGLPLYYLDMIYHNPDRTTVSREIFDTRLSEILETDRWIIDGNYQRTLPLRFEKCTEVFFFDLPVEECLMGAQSRIGQKREDMPWIEEEFDPEFRQYILDFSKDQLPRIYQLLEQYADSRTITIFHSREEADAWLRQ